VATVVRDQEDAGLDIVTDGNMWYDDYVGVIGSFCWYMYGTHRRIRTRTRAASIDGRRREKPGEALLDDWGGVHQQRSGHAWTDPAGRPFTITSRIREGSGESVRRAGPANLAWHVYFKHYKNAKELSFRAGADLQ